MKEKTFISLSNGFVEDAISSVIDVFYLLEFDMSKSQTDRQDEVAQDVAEDMKAEFEAWEAVGLEAFWNTEDLLE